MSEKKTSNTTGAKGSAQPRAARSADTKGSPKPKSTNTKKTTSTSKKTSVQTERQKRLLHRSVRAGVYLFLAFIGTLSLFKVEGFLLNWYKALFGALFGFGYYLTPLCFLGASVMLVARMKYKVRAREIAIFCVPVLFGAMGHMLRDFSAYPSGLAGIKQLCITGRELTSGGLISGLFGRLLKSAVSAGGGIFLCLLALIGCILVATGTNPIEAIKLLRPVPEEADDEDGEKREPAWMRRRREQQAAKAAEKAAAKEAAQAKAAAAPAPAPARGYDESLPFELNGKKTAAEKPQSGKKLSSLGGGFVDFFHKDEEEPAAPVRKDPTAPVVPTFDVSDVRLQEPAAGPAPAARPIFTEADKPAPAAAESSAEDDLLPFNFAEAPVVRKIDETPAAQTAPAAPAEAKTSAQPVDDAPFDLRGAKKADGTPLPPDAAFDIFTEDNPPPAELSLDEKRQAASEAHEQAAADNTVAAQLNKEAEKAEAGQYIYPPLSLLTPGEPSLGADHESIVRCAERLIDTLKSFNIEATIVNVTKGPTITRYELQLQRGIKFSKVTNLSDDIALALGASAVRIAPIPSNNSVGIEVPNDIQETVSLRDVLQNKSFSGAKSKVSFAVGKDIAGQCVVGDIAKMPHMLIAGTTGSGKSVCINSILISLIYKASPEEVRLILVDPKMIELGMYNGVPHLLIPVVTEPKKAAGALNWAVGEMMRRYKLLADYNVRSLEAYNEEVRRRGEGKVLPQIVIVIDELADLMMVAAKEVEESIARIAQMARAAGMHLIVATQRPSTDVITGLMKANIPSRVSFAVASQIESRIILDQTGAEKLIGRGDMLYNPLGAGKPQRVQGCFVSSPEVESVIEFVKKTSTAEYSQEVLDHIERQAEAQAAAARGDKGGDDDEEGDDPLLMDAISVVVDRGEASTSLLQRRLKLGYARAARLIDIMEERGIVGPFEGSKPRSVTLTRDQWAEMQLRMKG